MADIIVSGNSSGSVTLRAPDVSGTTVLTLPTVSGTIVTTAGATSLTTSGNLTFTGTGNRILGDFSNATSASRVAFQSSTTNGNTIIPVIANGTATTSGVNIYSSNDPANASILSLAQIGAESRINSFASGTGSNSPLTMYTGGAERLRIDTSGNVGIGTSTPATILTVYRNTAGSNPIGSISNSALRIQTDANEFSEKGEIQFQAGTVAANSGEVFAAISSLYTTFNGANDSGGALLFSTRQSTAAGGLLERMRISAAGLVGIGTNNPTQSLDVVGSIIAGSSITIGTGGLYQAGSIYSDANWGMLFRAKQASPAVAEFKWANSADTERMRITSGGDLLVGTPIADGKFIVSIGTNTLLSRFANTSTSGLSSDQVQITAFGMTTGLSGFHFLRCYANGATPQFAVRGDGVIFAQNTTVQSISDIRTKENITDAENGLAVINALRPVRFDFKDGFGNNKKNQLGFIAQEMEVVFPDAVSEVTGVKENDKEAYKTVGPSALIPVLVKAIQELNAKVTALEKQLGAK